MRKISVVGLYLSFVCVICSNYLNAQDCNEILEHGVFTHSSTASLSVKTQTFLNWLSQSTFDSYGQANEAAGKLGFSIDEIPISLSGHNRNTSWHEYQASLQTLNFSDTKILDQFAHTTDEADRAIVAAWQACILNIKGIPHLTLEQTEDPKGFNVIFSYSPAGPPPIVKISSFVARPANIVCSPELNPHWYWRKDLDSSGIILNCERKSPSDAVDITANTNKVPLQAKLPGMVTRPSGDPQAAAWHIQDQEGSPYLLSWWVEPACQDYKEKVSTKRCFNTPYGRIGEDKNDFNQWRLEMDAPGPVYEVDCTPGGLNLNAEQKREPDKGTIYGRTGECTGFVNQGAAQIHMIVKYKLQW